MSIEDSLSASIANRVLVGQDTVKNVEKILMEKVVIYGKTLTEWSDLLMINVKINSFEDDDDAIFRTLADYSAKIAKNIQMAEHLLGLFEMQASAANNFKEKEFARRYVEEFKNNEGKRIAAEKLRYMVIADEDIDKNEMASQSAAVIRDFFKRKVKGLEEARKSIENQITLHKQRIWLSSNKV